MMLEDVTVSRQAHYPVLLVSYLPASFFLFVLLQAILLSSQGCTFPRTRNCPPVHIPMKNPFPVHTHFFKVVADDLHVSSALNATS